MRWQKVLGVAAFAGVAATGAVIIRDQRRRRAYTPEQVRDRLHARLAESAETEAGLGAGVGAGVGVGATGEPPAPGICPAPRESQE
jgi:hypothetical protein